MGAWATRVGQQSGPEGQVWESSTKRGCQGKALARGPCKLGSGDHSNGDESPRTLHPQTLGLWWEAAQQQLLPPTLLLGHAAGTQLASKQCAAAKQFVTRHKELRHSLSNVGSNQTKCQVLHGSHGPGAQVASNKAALAQ